MKTLERWMNKGQAGAVREILRGEEREGMREIVARVENIIETMPKTYGQAEADEVMVYLHYFCGNFDWWIAEKDIDPDGEGQAQMYGIACMSGGMPEYGYISLPEILAVGAELDFHFAPRTAQEIIAEREGGAA